GSEIGPIEETHGNGLPAWTRLRRYQKPPPARSAAAHAAAVRHRAAAGAVAITPAGSAAVGAASGHLVPIAHPDASPAAKVAPGGIERRPSPAAAWAFTSSAAVARKNAIPTASLRASPGWNASVISEPRTTADPTSACGPRP